MSTISNGANRVSGLISGLDTEELVKAMTAHTKTRINSQKQKLQTLQWKQESYRGVISKISDFKNKYLDILSSTSIKANAVMKKCIATSSNDNYITATASANAVPAKYTIKEATAAKAATVSSSGTISTGEIRLDFARTVSGRDYNVEMTLDGVTKTVSFRGGANAEKSKQNFLDAANAVFAEIKGSDQKFEFAAGTTDLSFNGNDDVFHTFSVGYNKEAVGLANTTSNKITSNSALNSVGFKEKLIETDNGEYEFNINGVDFTVKKDAKISDIITMVNNSSAGVKLSFSNISQGFTLESKETGAAAEINMYQKKGNLLNAMFNISSDKLQPTQADTASVTYMGTAEKTGKLSSVVTDALKEGFTNDMDVNGHYKVKITDNDGNETTLTLKMGSLLNGTNSAYKDEDGNFTDEFITTAFNTEFRAAYSLATGNALGDDAVEFTYANGSLTIKSPDLRIDFSESTGFNNLTNAKEINASPAYIIAKDVQEMTFKDSNGEEIKVTATNESGISIQDLIDKGIVKLPTNGSMIAAADLEAADDNAKAFFNEYFGKESVVGAKDAEVIEAKGSNSMIYISSDGENFTKYSSASNIFTFDGTTINLSNKKEFKAETEDDYITVETAKDTSGVKEVIKTFVDDYNKLLSDLYGEVSTTRPKSSGSYYDPLTEEQEEEMSDKEIEKWNNNAKTGLLYRDSNIQKFLSELRSAMVTRVDGFGLSDLGIKLTTDWRDNGKLEIDESKLDSALATYGDKVADFFTSEKGLAARLEGVVDKAISTNKSRTKDANGNIVVKGYGYLSQVAGIEGTRTDKDNQIYKQIEYIQKIIDRLNTKYENEQERYWKKYTALESYMAKAQSQMSYFTDGSY